VFVKKRARVLFVSVASDDGGRDGGEFGDAAKNVFRRIGGEIANQLVVNRQIRREYEKVAEAVRQMQIADECAHQPRLAYTSRQGETERGEFAFKIGDTGKFAANDIERSVNVGVFAGRRDGSNAVKYFQRCALRRTQAQATRDSVDVAIHRFGLVVGIGTIKILGIMIAQQELQNLLTLPLAERLRIAQRLIDSAVAETEIGSALDAAPDEPSAGAKWLLSMAGIYSGGNPDTGERADEICQAEIKKRSGFTMKEELFD
jgi:hypothetical protein